MTPDPARPFATLPQSAAWQHQEARAGFEVVQFRQLTAGLLMTGCTTAVEDGRPWIVGYEIQLDQEWVTRVARVWDGASAEPHPVVLDHDGAGHWRVDRRPAPHLDGCLDVDLESSALTNALPVHRLGLRPDECAGAPAAYVRAQSLAVERLDQEYVRISADGHSYRYRAPAFDFACELSYDESGLVVTYPGIAVRAA